MEISDEHGKQNRHTGTNCILNTNCPLANCVQTPDFLSLKWYQSQWLMSTNTSCAHSVRATFATPTLFLSAVRPSARPACSANLTSRHTECAQDPIAHAKMPSFKCKAAGLPVSTAHSQSTKQPTSAPHLTLQASMLIMPRGLFWSSFFQSGAWKI